jgi:hypothetical protein
MEKRSNKSTKRANKPINLSDGFPINLITGQRRESLNAKMGEFGSRS